MNNPNLETSSVLFLLDLEILPNPEISDEELKYASDVFEKQYWILMESGRLLPVNHKPYFPTRFFLIDSFDSKTKSSLLLADHLESGKVTDWSLKCACNYSSDLNHHYFEEDYIVWERGSYYLAGIREAWGNMAKSMLELEKELRIMEDLD